MKRGILAALLCVVTACAAGLCACDNQKTGDEWGDVYTVQAAYAAATELGYSGTLEEFIALISGKDGKDGTDGKDGVGVDDAYIDDSGDLIITLTNGNKINCGNVRENAPDGLLYSEIKDNGQVKGYAVSGFGVATASVIIPSSFNGKPVLEIGENAFSGSGVIQSVTIPDSVTRIGGKAFYACENLKSVTVGKGVTVIDNTAFSKCEGLESVNITNLACWCEISFGGLSANPLYFAHNLYINNVLVENLVIPDSVQKISDYAFYGCANLTTVNTGNGAKSIGDSAFYGCENLKSLTVGNAVTQIGNSAFLDCNLLESLVLGKSVQNIGDYAFTQCLALTAVELPSSMRTIGECAFTGCESLKTVDLNYGLTTIGDCAFGGCVALERLIMPNTVTETGWGIAMFEVGNVGFEGGGVLNNCLTEIVISDGLTVINDFSFSKSNIKSAVIGKSVERIKYSSFYGCGLLESVVMPKSVTRIESYAFYQCYALGKVYYEGTASEWSKIIIGKNGNEISNARIYCYSENPPAEDGNFWHYVNGVPTAWNAE